MPGSGPANDGIGGVNGGGGNGLLTSTGGEGLQLDLALDSHQFAFTLDHFNTTGTSNEQVLLSFYETAGGIATAVGSPVTKASCAAADTQSESFSVDAGVTFNRVVVQPVAATGGGASRLVPLGIPAADVCRGVSCVTILAPSGHTCPQ